MEEQKHHQGGSSLELAEHEPMTAIEVTLGMGAIWRSSDSLQLRCEMCYLPFCRPSNYQPSLIHLHIIEV